MRCCRPLSAARADTENGHRMDGPWDASLHCETSLLTWSQDEKCTAETNQDRP